MGSTCHLCGRRVSLTGDARGDATDGFACADCGEPTCHDCKSIGVGRPSDHCRRCRG